MEPGKTTTLRSPFRYSATDRRFSLRIGGYDIVKEPVKAKQVLAFVPDEPNLFEALTVWEHLRFIASAYRLDNFEETGEKTVRSI